MCTINAFCRVQELKKDLKVARDLTNAAQKSAASADIQRKTVETEKAALEQDVRITHQQILVYTSLITFFLCR